MSTEMTAKKETRLTRPLAVIVPIIRGELKEINGEYESIQKAEGIIANAQKRSLEHYVAAGKLFIEAKEAVTEEEGPGKWTAWLERQKFGIAERTIRDWMRAAGYTESASAARRLRTLSEASGRPDGPSHRPAWVEEIKKQVKSVNYAALAREDVTKKQEDSLIRELALRLIEIGYRALASELHPDKPGGSGEAFGRLNKVRKMLKEAVS